MNTADKHSADVIVTAQHTPRHLSHTHNTDAVANLASWVEPFIVCSPPQASRLTWALGYVEAG